MKNILVIVDMQNGIYSCADKNQMMLLTGKIQELLYSNVFDRIVATRFRNHEDSIFESLLDWCDFGIEEDFKLIYDFENYVDAIFDKTIYTCVNTDFLQRVCQLNDGNYPARLSKILSS